MTTFFVTIFSFLVVLAGLILAHEFGHFSSAKLLGVRVLEFGLGFPPRVAAIRRKGTLYSLNALPLGGFVKMLGENGEEAHEPDSFGAQPWWQRGLILVAGPTMNLCLALVLFFVTAAWVGTPIGTNAVNAVASHSPAQRAGLLPGDRIVAFDGRRTRSLLRIHNLTQQNLGKPVVLTIDRSGRLFTVHVVPRVSPPAGEGAIGIVASFTTKRYPLSTALSQAFQNVGTTIMAVPSLIQNIERHGTQNISGPVGIARLTGDAASSVPQTGWGELLAFIALLSANLGVLNLLPIPALDGGRLLLVIVSGIRRRNLNPELEGMIHLVGMAILLMLIALISYQDIARWISGG